MLPTTRLANRFRLPKLELKEDRSILLICIGIALVFWLLVKLSQTYRAEQEVNLHFVLPENKTFAVVPPQDIKVQLEGKGWDLLFENFSNREVPLYYDLRESDRLELNRGQLRTDILNSLRAKDLKITEVNYDDINLFLEEKASNCDPVSLLIRNITCGSPFPFHPIVWRSADRLLPSN